MFPHLADAAKMLDPRARTFVVDDNRRILVDGLESIESVEIDGCPMPAMEERPFAVQELGKEATTVQHMVPLWTVQDIPGFGRCLIRSMYSNHGEWQIGSQVTIIGEWAEGPSESFVSTLLVQDELGKLKANHAAEIAAKDAEIAALKADKKSEPKAKDEKPKSTKSEKPASDPPKSEAPALDKSALKARAKELKINPIGKSPERLAELIAEKEAETAAQGQGS